MNKSNLMTAVINNGQFTASGNFSGYTVTGVRVHIKKRQMAACNWEENEDVKFPFYCLVEEKEITPFLADGKTPASEKVMRLTARSVFITVDALAEAKGEKILVDAKENTIIARQATAAGLTDDVINALLSVAV